MSFCSAAEPVGGILMSTCTLASCSYLCTPDDATFQNSPGPFVTNASFSTLPAAAGASAALAAVVPDGAGASDLLQAVRAVASVAPHQSNNERLLEDCIEG